LVNAEWCDVYPISNVYNMPLIHSLSDHAAILLSTDGPVRKIKKRFKFENWWLKEYDFQNYVESIWCTSKINPSLIELTILQALSKFGAKRKNLFNRN
jgi:hypothetical protein